MPNNEKTLIVYDGGPRAKETVIRNPFEVSLAGGVKLRVMVELKSKNQNPSPRDKIKIVTLRLENISDEEASTIIKHVVNELSGRGRLGVVLRHYLKQQELAPCATVEKNSPPIEPPKRLVFEQFMSADEIKNLLRRNLDLYEEECFPEAGIFNGSELKLLKQFSSSFSSNTNIFQGSVITQKALLQMLEIASTAFLRKTGDHESIVSVDINSSHFDCGKIRIGDTIQIFAKTTETEHFNCIRTEVIRMDNRDCFRRIARDAQFHSLGYTTWNVV
jgi:predicted nuclease of predicted toxin-antitoxin system